MKKGLLGSLAVLMLVVLAACGGGNGGNGGSGGETVTLKVGASTTPHADILEVVKPKLEEQGVNLEIIEFTDYVQPNVQLNEKKLDANYFQHIPYLEQFNHDQKMDLVNAGGIHIEPMGAYSQKIKSADELQDGAKVAIPNDPSNAGRALLLMEKNGLLKLKEGVGVNATVNDVVENPKNLQFEEMDPAMLPRALPDVDMAVINTNYALEGGLVPTEDALFIEGSDSPYVNIIAARQDNKDSDAVKKLVEALQSDEVKQYIEENYKGAIVPAF